MARVAAVPKGMLRNPGLSATNRSVDGPDRASKCLEKPYE